MRIYNTLTHSIEQFKPIHDKKVGMYTCGLTVYNYAHIGNFRYFIAADLLKRVLIHEGYVVKHVENITDVGHLADDSNLGEDKMAKAAKREHRTMAEVAQFYTEAFLMDMTMLNVTSPGVLVKATDHIPEMLSMMDALYKKGFLYEVKTGMYFDTSKIKDYGILMGMDFKKLNESLVSGARVERIAGIKNKTDFAVWRFLDSQDAEMVWDTKYGKGFPGWHLECSAISMKYLGAHFDIHCGGVDHITIHHTNEIAQSEAANGKNPARYWWHSEFLLVEGRKMSKSLGNTYTLKNIVEKGYSPMALKYFLLSGYYRQQLNFTFEALDNASNTLKGIYTFLRRLSEMEPEDNSSVFMTAVKKHKEEFFADLENDLNTPKAFAAMHSIIAEAGKRMETDSLGKKDAAAIKKMMLEIDEVLGLDFASHLKSKQAELPKEAEKLIEKREAARNKKDFKESDRIRKELLEEYNIIIEDTKSGLKWHFA